MTVTARSAAAGPGLTLVMARCAPMRLRASSVMMPTTLFTSCAALSREEMPESFWSWRLCRRAASSARLRSVMSMTTPGNRVGAPPASRSAPAARGHPAHRAVRLADAVFRVEAPALAGGFGDSVGHAVAVFLVDAARVVFQRGRRRRPRG